MNQNQWKINQHRRQTKQNIEKPWKTYEILGKINQNHWTINEKPWTIIEQLWQINEKPLRNH